MNDSWHGWCLQDVCKPALLRPVTQVEHRVCTLFILSQETTMKWDTPSYVEMRFGFEITMYIANR